MALCFLCDRFGTESVGFQVPITEIKRFATIWGKKHLVCNAVAVGCTMHVVDRHLPNMDTIHSFDLLLPLDPFGGCRAARF